MTVAYNPFSPQVIADPYPYYEELRREAPVVKLDPMGFWAISRYEDVLNVLKNHELFSSASLGSMGGPGGGGMGRTIIGMDPPQHTRVRNLVSRVFTPRMVDALEPRIREITVEALDRVASAGEFDLIEDLATPVPVVVIAEILGVDISRRDDFKRWSDALVFSRSAGSADSSTADSMREFRSYFQAVIEERRREPREDLISALVRAEEAETLTPEEVLSFTLLLLIAGNETTTNLVGNGMLALLKEPEQLEAVQNDPSLIPNMVEEALRYDGPVQFLFRTATTDSEVGGVPVPRGAFILPIFASANHDEDRYRDPERFDITRNTQGHMAFGHGVHFCLGAPLARLEARVIFEELLARFRNFERIEPEKLDRIYSFILRGLHHLPLRFTPAE